MAKRAKRSTAKQRKRASGRGPRRAPRLAKSPSRHRKLSRSRKAARGSVRTRRTAVPTQPAGKTARLDRARRTLDEGVPTPPSSLDLDRHASAARTGRAELDTRLHERTGMSPAITGGDVDADWENAYFSGDEAPGGDNPTPDQEIVDDIGKSLGVLYDDAEELKSSDKVVERDKHRWELNPASSEDYKDRK